MENILIIDTCITPAQLGLYKKESNGKIASVSFIKIDAGNMLNEKLFDVLDELLKKEKIGKKNITKIACVVGPGSFTGIRVGIALAKGLIEGLGIDAVAVNSFDKFDNEHAIALDCDNETVYLKIKDKIFDKPVKKEDVKSLAEGTKILTQDDADNNILISNIEKNFLNAKNHPLTPLYIKGHYAEK
jgi:tRNA threonylcarbamoyl adenosine modification protein YeaZ